MLICPFNSCGTSIFFLMSSNIAEAMTLFVASMTASEDSLVNLIKKINPRPQIEMFDRIPIISLPNNAFDSVISTLNETLNHVPLLKTFYRCLKDGGSLNFIQICPINSSEGVTAHELKSNLVLNGFTSIDLQISSLQNNIHREIVTINCKTPEWKSQNSAKLSFGTKFKKDNTSLNGDSLKADSSNIWTISNDENQELIDEGLLLDKDDLIVPPTAAPGDCSTRKKACKDCTCGRAEAEMMEGIDLSKNVTVVTNKTSSCGSCYLGDAFRCGTCPYLGMPAFKPGEIVTIGLSDDV